MYLKNMFSFNGTDFCHILNEGLLMVFKLKNEIQEVKKIVHRKP